MPKNNVILPGKTLGIIGGGQLGKMMAIEAKAMGYQVIVLDPTPNCPTAQVSDDHIVANYDDLGAIQELTERSDVITYEFENIDVKAAQYIEKEGKLPQGYKVLEITQNRDQEKQLMEKLNLPVADFQILHKKKDCKQALEKIGLPAVIKTCHGGYDGKGQLKIDSWKDLPEVEAFYIKQNQRCIIERWIPFEREISVVFTRGLNGEITFFPIAENHHRHHILDETIVPAQITDAVGQKALEIARKIADFLKVVGTFAIEMFVKEDEVFVNELAPRPHNSGHYTIEACNVNQFSQHVRAVCGLPLQEIRLLEVATMKNLLGEHMEALYQILPQLREGSLYLYGKEEIKEKRKMGHITFTAKTEHERNQVVAKFKEALE